jgi:hypothetical protein
MESPSISLASPTSNSIRTVPGTEIIQPELTAAKTNLFRIYFTF